jgi:hypothetical protein
MRTVSIGLVTGACFCLLALAVLGAIDGYFNPDGYPPGQLPGLPRSVVGCIWALAYFGPPAASAGALVGGTVGGIGAGIGWALAKTRRSNDSRQSARIGASDD